MRPTLYTLKEGREGGVRPLLANEMICITFDKPRSRKEEVFNSKYSFQVQQLAKMEGIIILTLACTDAIHAVSTENRKGNGEI